MIDGPNAAPTTSFALVSRGEGLERRVPFAHQLEIGRRTEDREETDGVLLIQDPTVSYRHCVVYREGERSCFVRDTSRNGTWLNGRRLVPYVPARIRPGQVLSLGEGHHFVLEGAELPTLEERRPSRGGTMLENEPTEVTVLVGDVRDYTRLVSHVSAKALQSALPKIFQRLEAEIGELGGTVKEYQGDAVFAFWERHTNEECAAAACRTALALDRLGARLAQDRTLWDFPSFPLRLDWAVASGPVVILAHGAHSPMGLSMVGPVVPLAFRLEKLANEETGPIVVCERTHLLAGDAFEFRDLGRRPVKGFDEAPRVFSLLRERDPLAAPR
jgi:adenylate cyclase